MSEVTKVYGVFMDGRELMRVTSSKGEADKAVTAITSRANHKAEVVEGIARIVKKVNAVRSRSLVVHSKQVTAYSIHKYLAGEVSSWEMA